MNAELSERINLKAELSDREIEILETVCFGHSYKETADKLSISTKTVDNTIQTVKKKTGVSKITELGVFCFCRKFNIPISMCEPAKRTIAIFFLVLFSTGEIYHSNVLLRSEINSRTRSEEIVRIRRD